MQPTREEGLELVRLVAVGDLPRTDERVVAACRAWPELAAELDDLAALQQELDGSGGGDAASVAAAARGRATAADRRLVRDALGGRRPRAFGWLLLAAALLFAAGAAAWLWRPSTARDGSLGGRSPFRVSRDAGGEYTIAVDNASPGARYEVRLWLDDAQRPLVATFLDAPMQLSREWRQAIDDARTARLQITCSDPPAELDAPLKD